ncbi:hypothetical protein L1049_024751 [Liquidambar formosana]|uniref:Uncharacterized protein n=1 Tax=Liquidambar formosana TaxID=63359 RepID=A0AAP0S148_LIQFO
MFQTSTTDSGCNDGGDSLHAGLLSTANSSSGTGKRRGFWHIVICVRLLISISKRPFDHHHGVSSPLSSSAVPPPPIDKQFSRTSSSSSQFVIDIRINSEIEEESPDEPEVDEQEQLRRIVQEKDLDSLRRFGGVKRVASVLGSNLDTGIDRPSELEVLRWNTEGFLHFFLEACNSYTILLLLLSAGLSFGNQMIDKGPKYGWHEGATILFAIFLLVTFPSVANFRHARKLEKKLLGCSPVGNSVSSLLVCWFVCKVGSVDRGGVIMVVP